MNAERKFLHDISTPLAAAMLSMELLQERAKKQGVVPAPGDMLSNAISALEKVQALIILRKTELSGEKN